MKIVHFTTVHTRQDSRIFYKQCRSLQQYGYEVVLIAPGTEDRQIDGVYIKNFIVNQSRIKRILISPLFLYRKVLSEQADLYHFHDPELLLIGILLKINGKKVIYDVHEDYPKNIRYKSYLPNWLKPLMVYIMTFLEKLAGGIFDGIISTTPTIAKRFPMNKTSIVRNYCDLKEPHWQNITEYDARPHACLYLGSLSQQRQLHKIINALNKVDPTLQIKLNLVGTFHCQKLQQSLKQLPGWQFVNYFGEVSRDTLDSAFSSARIGILVLPKLLTYIDSYPIKLFEYMAAGLPIVASDFPIWRNIIERTQCGLLVDPENETAIAKAIQYLMLHPKAAKLMGERGKKAVAAFYNWSSEEKTLLLAYKKILNESLA